MMYLGLSAPADPYRDKGRHRTAATLSLVIVLSVTESLHVRERLRRQTPQKQTPDILPIGTRATWQA